MPIIDRISLHLFFQVNEECNLQYDLNDLDDAVDHKHDTEGGIAVLGEEGRDDGEQEVDEGKEPCHHIPLLEVKVLCDFPYFYRVSHS